MRRPAAICTGGYLVGVLAWLTIVAAWLAVERTKALHDPWLWYDSVHALVFQTKHGAEFLLVTLHLWGSVFSVAALSWARRRTRPLMTVSGLLLVVVCFSLLFTSIRWFHGEIGLFFHRYPSIINRATGKPVSYQPPFNTFGLSVFESEMDYRALLLGTLAFLGVLAIWWKGSAPAHDPATPKRTLMAQAEDRPSTILLSAVIVALALALVVQHQRAARREEALLERESALLLEMHERIRKKIQENEVLKRRIERLEKVSARYRIAPRDRRPGPN